MRRSGSPCDAGAAEAMLERLSGRTHEVVSGLCLRTAAWEELHSETTLVTFRSLDARDLAHYVSSGEWEGRAGGICNPGPRRVARRAHRGRLPERRRPPSRAARPSPVATLPRNVRLRLIQPLSGVRRQTWRSADTRHRSKAKSLDVEEAAPRPLGRVSAKACTHWVERDVAHRLREVLFRLDEPRGRIAVERGARRARMAFVEVRRRTRCSVAACPATDSAAESRRAGESGSSSGSTRACRQP